MRKPLRAEVLVIGGGPAGLAAAIAARQQGFDVAVAEAAHPPIDKACGEGILPAGVQALRRLGIPLDDAFPLRGIRFLCGTAVVDAPFSACGIALRRTSLHELLACRAARLGIRLLWGTTIRDSSDLSCCRWIVGADGQHSGVRRDAHLDAKASSIRYGFRRHYQLAPWTDVVEVYWGARSQVYVTPVAPDEVGVALLARDSHLRLDGALYEFPSLERRLRSASVTALVNSAERGGVTVSRRLPRVYHGRTVLIGDASGSVDAITGDGLTLCFLQAHALAAALAEGDLHRYQAEHRRLSRKPALMANALLLLDRFPHLRRIVIRGLQWHPWIFSTLLASHAPNV